LFEDTQFSVPNIGLDAIEMRETDLSFSTNFCKEARLHQNILG